MKLTHICDKCSRKTMDVQHMVILDSKFVAVIKCQCGNITITNPTHDKLQEYIRVSLKNHEM